MDVIADDCLNSDIAALGLNRRDTNVLRQASSCNTIGELVKKGSTELLKWKGFGRKRLTSLQESLTQRGLSLLGSYDPPLDEPMHYFVDPCDLASDMDAPVVRQRCQNGGYVYAVKSLTLTKIGVTVYLDMRMRNLAAMSAADVALVFHKAFSDYRVALKAEQSMHECFSALRHHGEWFSLSEDDLERLRTAIDEYDAVSEGSLTHDCRSCA